MNEGTLKAIISTAQKIRDCLPQNLGGALFYEVLNYKDLLVDACTEILRKYAERRAYFERRKVHYPEKQTGIINDMLDGQTGEMKMTFCKYLENIDNLNLNLDHHPELMKEVAILKQLGRSLKLLPEDLAENEDSDG